LNGNGINEPSSHPVGFGAKSQVYDDDVLLVVAAGEGTNLDGWNEFWIMGYCSLSLFEADTDVERRIAAAVNTVEKYIV
jgi:hypothetical protein